MLSAFSPKLCALLLVFLFHLPAHAQAALPDKLLFGLLPTESPISLFKRFSPLRDYINRDLQRYEVIFETAKSFPAFIKRTAERRYDILLTAPHLALLAHDSDKYELIASFYRPIRSSFILRPDNHGIHTLADLRGKTVATPPEQAIVGMVGRQMLEAAGLRVGQDVFLQPFMTHAAALRALQGGEVDAAVVVNLIYRKYRDEQSQRLKLLVESHDFPGAGILVAKDLPLPLRRNLQSILTGMRQHTEGLSVLGKITQPGFAPARIDAFEILRPYLRLFTKLDGHRHSSMDVKNVRARQKHAWRDNIYY